MKFCQKCGKEIMDEAVICPGCGCSVVQEKNNVRKDTDGLAITSKIFLIISCILQGWLIIPLAWCLPITITVCNRMRRGEDVGIGLKICSLLFVSTIGGILLLCRADN